MTTSKPEPVRGRLATIAPAARWWRRSASWTAVARLQAHAAVQHRPEEKMDAGNPAVAQIRARAGTMLRAADVITRHVLPLFTAERPR
jgi:hypothetical protein